MSNSKYHSISIGQGWAQDLLGRDRDQDRDLSSRDRDETRPRRLPNCPRRDWDETLECPRRDRDEIFFWLRLGLYMHGIRAVARLFGAPVQHFAWGPWPYKCNLEICLNDFEMKCFIIVIWDLSGSDPRTPILDCLEERNFLKLFFQIVRFGAHSGSNYYYLYSNARVTIGYNSLYEFLDFEIFIA